VTDCGSPRSADEGRPPSHHCEVYLEVGVLPTQLAPVRVVAGELAARADFDLDAVADLRLAVDEVCSMLATLAPLDARMRCLLRTEPDWITVTVWIPGLRAAAVPRDTFGWRVLVTLADKVEVLGTDGSGARSLGVRLLKARQAGTS